MKTTMQIQSIVGWHDHILAGRKYLKTAANGLSRPAVFNNELMFQWMENPMDTRALTIRPAQCRHELMPTEQFRD